MKTKAPPKGKPASQLIDARIRELGDWRGTLLGRIRTLMKEADPEIVEEWKWNGPAWSRAGLFNSSLEGNTRRAIDFHEGAKIDDKALKRLVRAAVTLNRFKADA